MIEYIILVLAIIAIGGGIYYYFNYYVPIQTPISQSPYTMAPTCKFFPAIWLHVHNVSSYTILGNCTVVSGQVNKIENESDGNIRIFLGIGEQDLSLLNYANTVLAANNLVVEEICVNPTNNTVALNYCSNYKNYFPIPKVGDLITVSGPWVQSSAIGWNEIIPAFNITVG